MRLTLEQSRLFAAEVSAAADRPDVIAAVTEIYRRVQGQIDARQPVCQMSGRCCRFESFGHRLFVTTAEMAAFGRQLPTTQACQTPWDGAGCLYQIGGRCSVHGIRPFGCRIFFCDATSTQWQQEQYEQFHAEIRALHDRLGVPYLYVEWREALRATSVIAECEPDSL